MTTDTGKAAEIPARDDETPRNFIWDIVQEDLRNGKHGGRVQTRFPPEPNGYLHIGHAKAICLNFGIARDVPGAKCHLRFDDTNPEVEDVEYVDSIKNDIHWLGFQWPGVELYASDYFPKIHDFAVQMIKDGRAYVDSRPMDVIRATRGDFYKPGESSADRERGVEENLDLFARMRAGEFPDGAHVLRAKGDLASIDVKMRDPIMYRIRHANHHRTGNTWCIYPMYDWAHGQSDYLEGVTHSVCTLEFVNHHALYDWYMDQVGAKVGARPEQIEFARLNLTYTVLSKRRLNELVMGKHVDGWDDPRMPTLAGMRRRGFTPEAIRNFCDRVGVAKRDSFVEVALLEHALREDLNARAPRIMGVLRPLKVTIANFPEGEVIDFEAPFFPEGHEAPASGTTATELGASRKVPFTREIYIEEEDFMEVPAKKWFRLAPGSEVRLRYACVVKCIEVKKDASGKVTELVCEWDPSSRGGSPADGRKIKGTVHWVSATHAVNATAHLYDRLFSVENPLEAKDDYLQHLNPKSLETLTIAKVEPAAKTLANGSLVQFERLGYFAVDKASTTEALIFNRTITLKDAWIPAK